MADVQPGANLASSKELWLAFASVTTATFMVNVDSSIVNVALPVLSHQFRLGINALQWVVTMYLLVITATLPVMAKLADVFGRRRVFVWGLAVFVVGSLLCGLSNNFSELVAARALQGIGGAIMQVNVMSIVTLMFPLDMRGRALGTVASVVAGGTLMGPVLGGVLISAFGWPSIFFVNLPVGLLGILGTRRFVPAFPGRPTAGRFDWFGGVLFAAFVIVFLTLFADLSGRIDPLRDSFLALAAVALGVWFVRVERRQTDPLVVLSVFREPLFSAAMGAGMLYWILMLFPAFLLPLFLQRVLGTPEWEIGLLMTPLSVVMLVVAPAGGYLTDRFGTFRPAVAGVAVFIAADVWFAMFGSRMSLWEVAAALGVQGVASGLFSSPNNSEIFARADESLTGIVGGLIASERNFGRSLGVTVAALALSFGIKLAGGHGDTVALRDIPGPIFVKGFDAAFWAATGIAVACLLLVVIPYRRRGRAPYG